MKHVLILLAIAALMFSCEEQNNIIDPPPNNFNSELLYEVNLLRTNPAVYIQHLERMRQYFKGNIYQEPGKMALMTNEGVSAVNEAILILQNTNPVISLKISSGLNKACEYHAKMQGPTGQTGHVSPDGSKVKDRLLRHGSFLEHDWAYGENIAYGAETPREIVLQLVIDDGVPSRGHRENLLNSNYDGVGFAFYTHSVYRYMCVIVFTKNFIDR